MNYKLSPNKETKSVFRQLSYGKKNIPPIKKKKIIDNINDISTFSMDIPIDQRIKLICTPQSVVKKEDNISGNNASFSLTQNLCSPTQKQSMRRKSLIDIALGSDEFFVESMKEFKSFRKTIDKITLSNNRRKTVDSNSFFGSFKTPQQSRLMKSSYRKKSVQSIPTTKKQLISSIEDCSFETNHHYKLDKIYQSPELASEFSLSSQKDKSGRRMRRFNSVYDSLSDDEDDKNNKIKFDYNEDKYIFDLDTSYFLLGWNYLIFLVIIYSTYHCPIQLAFSKREDKFKWDDFIYDILFLFDIIITFFTPFIQEEIIVKNFSEISVHYLKTSFTFDLIISLPFELSSLPDNPSVFYYFKWFRLFRVVKLYSKEKNIEFSSRYLYLNISEFKVIVVLFIVFFVLIHFTSCLWAYLAISNNNPANWLIAHARGSETKTDIYVASLYFVVVTILGVGYGDIYGENDIEVMFSIILMLIGQLMFSFVLGSLSRLFEILDSENIQIEAKMEQLSQIALKYNINKTLKANISRSIKQKIKKLNFDYYSFSDSLHKKLKCELILQMHRNHIKNLNFFNDQKYDFIVYVLPLMQKTTYNKNEFIFSIGDKINEMYLVTQGCLSLKLGSSYDNIEIGQIRKRCHFGEIQLHFQSQSVYDFKAKTNTEAFLINQKDFMQIKDNFPMDINVILRESIRTMEIFETRRGLILLLVSYGFYPSMFISLLRKIDSLIMQEDFNDYYFHNKEMREISNYINKLDESKIIKLIDDTFHNMKVRPSMNTWTNPRQNLINVRTKVLIQKLLSFNQGKINENGQYEFEMNNSIPQSDEEKIVNDISRTMNDSIRRTSQQYIFNAHTIQTKTFNIPIEMEKGSDLKLSQLRNEITLKKNKGNHDMLRELRDEIVSLQHLTKQEPNENRNRLPLWEGDISQVRKEEKKKNKFSKENRDKILKQLKLNLELLNGIYSIYKMLSIKNQYEL